MDIQYSKQTSKSYDHTVKMQKYLIQKYCFFLGEFDFGLFFRLNLDIEFLALVVEQFGVALPHIRPLCCFRLRKSLILCGFWRGYYNTTQTRKKHFVREIRFACERCCGV